MHADAFRFAEFTFHPRDGRLLRAGEAVPLQPKAWELLALLLSEEPGRLWSRDELDRRLWPAEHVTQDSLTQAIRRIRVALHDTGEVPRFVETVPRRGYRWVWPSASRPILAVEPEPAPDLLGRDRELALARGMLGEGPLVTVLGPGGAGKTRLALALAGSSGAVIRLADAADEDGVRSAVAAALGLPDEPIGWDGLGAALDRAGPRMWVLDEAERVAGALGAALAAWLGRAPRARFLVTSRVRLGLAAERCLELGGLDRGAGIALYRERAARVEPASRDPDEAIAALVDALDGLPLAIELAAARRRVVDPAGVRARLAGGLDVLDGDRPDVAPRHRSMRAAVGSSWDALEPREREAVGRLGQLCGFSTDLAEQVLADLGAPFALVERLRDHGLVRRREESDRFDVFAVVRAHAEERLAADGALRPIRRRVAEVLAARFRSLEPGPTPRIAVDRDSYARALEACDDEELAVTLLFAVLRCDAGALPWRALLARVDEVRARVTRHDLARRLADRRIRFLFPVDGPRALADAEALVAASPDDPEALTLLGLCLKPTPDVARAREVVARAVAAASDPLVRGRALRVAALVELRTGRWGEGLGHAERAIHELEAAGHPYEASRAAVISGSLAYLVGDLGRAHRTMLAAVEVLDRRHDARLLNDALSGIALVADAEGRLDEAEAIRRELAEGVVPRASLLALASLALRRGAPEEADRILANCPVGRAIEEADHHHARAAVRMVTGDLDAAAELLELARDRYHHLRFAGGEGTALVDLALLRALRGDGEGCAARVAEADALLADSEGKAPDSWRRVGRSLAVVAAAVAGDAEAARRRSGAAEDIRRASPIGPTTGRPAPYPDIALRLAFVAGALPARR